MNHLKQILMFTNIMTPYRKTFYEDFYNQCKSHGIDFKILVMASTEKERHWKYEDYKTEFTELMTGHHFTISGIETHLNTNIIKNIKEYKPDIIMIVGGYMLLTNFYIVLERKKIGVPLIYWNESHLDETRSYGSMKLKLREMIRNYYFPKISGFWYAGEKAKKFIDKYRNIRSTCYFMPNIIDNSVFNVISSTSDEQCKFIKKKYGLPLDKKIMICPARLNKIKGIHVFMDVLKNVPSREKTCVVIAGDGGMREKLEKKAQSLQLNFCFVGYKQQEEMIELYKAADIFLLPSLSDPNPLSVIEALWGGKPLILTTHVGNYPEAVNVGVNGVVMDYSDTEAAARMVEYVIIADKAWMKKAKETSLKIARTIYNPNVVIEKTINEMIEDYVSGRLALR